MKILQVCPYDFSRPGGVKTHILGLSKYLRNQGHTVMIAAPNINTENVAESNVFFFGKNRSLNLGGTKIDINKAIGQEKRALKDFLECEKFDVIHYHTIWNPLLPFQIRWRSKAKNIATFHDTPANKWVGKWLMPLAATFIFKFIDKVISVSESQSKYIKRFSRKTVHIIPNGIDLQDYAMDDESDKTLDSDKFNCLFVGRLEPRKGFEYALKAFESLQKKHPETYLTVVGTGDELAHHQTYIKSNGISNLQFLGAVDDEQKKKLFSEADLYLAPALYGESFGIVLLESMALGCPMIGFGNDGYMNVIDQKFEEFFPEPGNLNKLIAVLEKMYLDKTSRDQMIQWGKEEVLKYDWSVVGPRIERLYI